MDDIKYLTEQISICRKKMNLAKVLDYGVIFAAAGGIAGMLCELASLIWPFYHVHLAAALCFGIGLLAGIGYAIYRRADMRQAAMQLDSFGLKERMVTAYELMGRESELTRIQRKDACSHYDRVRERIRIPLLPDWRHILALLLSAAVVFGMSFIPSSVRDWALLHHQVQEKAQEEQEELEELQEALEGVDMDSLTEEQKARLQELSEAMQRSREELAQADSWESLNAALDRLDYKYDQAAQSLDNLASQLQNPESAGVASAQALAQAMANQNGQQMASAGTPSGNPGSGENSNEGNGGSSDGGGQDGGQGNGNDTNSGDGGNFAGQDGGDGSGNESGSSSGNGSGDGSGNGSGDGSGNGSGDGSGNGGGDGSGNESGGGSGSGSGGDNGGGRGTGSSNAAHDYVSIPNAVGDDPALTGEKVGDQNSQYFRQQNGLAWEGEHVDYNSVIGEYADSAYEGIASGRYPSGMENVIRDYFENLNK